MRWFWIDRFIEFTSGESATAVKSVSLGEPHLHGHFPGHPVMPTSLIVEGLAQTGGLLVAEQSEFRNKVVLAKVGQAKFHQMAVPGDQLTYHAKLTRLLDEGAIVEGESRIGDLVNAEVQLVFAFLGDEFSGRQLFDPAFLANMLNVLRLYEIGKKQDGSPLEMPEYMMQAMKNGRSDS